MSTEPSQEVSSEEMLVIGVISGSEFVNHMFIVVVPPIIGLLAADFDVSLTMLGFAIGAQGFTMTVFQLPFGYLSDNYSRTLGLGLSIGIGSLGMLILALAPSYPVLVLGQAISGIGIAGHHPIHYPLLSNAVPVSLRGRAFSIRGFAGSLGFASPPALVTAVLSFSGTSWRHAAGIVGVVGALYGITAVIIFSRYVSDDLSLPDLSDADSDHSDVPILSRLKMEVYAFFASPGVVALGALAFGMAIVGTGFRSYVVIQLTDGYGLSLDWANLTLTGMFMMGAVTMLVGGYLSDRFQPGIVLVATFLVTAVFLGIFTSLIVPAVIAPVLVIAIEGFRSMTAPPRDKLVDRFSDDVNLGRSFAVLTIGSFLGVTIAPPIVGALIDSYGVVMAFLSLVATAFVVVLLAIGVLIQFD